jgi:sugar lactone lactonase YvrE
MKGTKHMKKITKFIYAAFASVILATGALTAHGAPSDLFASINGVYENGAGSIYQYRPDGRNRVFASGLSQPRGVTFDHFGNLFVTNNTCETACQLTIVKITPDGVQSTFATLSGDLYGEDVAFDRAGNLFVMAQDDTSPIFASTIYKFTPGGVQSTFGSLPGAGFGLAFDKAGNLFAADWGSQTIYEFAPNGTQTTFVGPTAFDPDHGPTGLAFDRFGNLFVSLYGGDGPCSDDRIIKFTPDGVGHDFTTEVCSPRGLAFDRNGNLFVAERGWPPPGDILKFTPDGIRTVFTVVPGDIATGPQFLAFQRR